MPERNSPDGGPPSSVIRCSGPVVASADSSSGPARRSSRSGTPGSPGGRAPLSAAAVGSTVTASWMLRPSSLDSVLVIRARSLVSSCSLTNSLGVAISAVFSTRPSGLVSWSHARWAGSICIPASSSRDRAQISARSASLIAVHLAPPHMINRFFHRLCTLHRGADARPSVAGGSEFGDRQIPDPHARDRYPQPRARVRRSFGKRQVLRRVPGEMLVGRPAGLTEPVRSRFDRGYLVRVPFIGLAHTGLLFSCPRPSGGASSTPSHLQL